MSGIEQVTENYLARLRAGDAVETSWQGAAVFLFHAGFATALSGSAQELVDRLLPTTNPVILLAEERQFIQHVGAFDLELSDSLDHGAILHFDGLIGIRDQFVDERGGGFLQLVPDKFLAGLVKRLGAPIAAIRLAAAPDH